MNYPDITPQRRRELEQYAGFPISDLEFQAASDLFFSETDWTKYDKPPTKKELKRREEAEREHIKHNAEMDALAPRTPLEWVILREIENERKQAKINADAIAVRRGKKNISATAKGGKVIADMYKNKADAALMVLKKYLELHSTVSLTAARNRIAAQFGISRKTLERYAKKPPCKK